MSDDRTPREPAQTATLSCGAGVTREKLSAWRDDLLPADEAAWLDAHTPTCPACSARLRDYDAIGAARRGQIVPRSSADPWPARYPDRPERLHPDIARWLATALAHHR